MSSSIRLYSLEDAIVAFSAGEFVLIHDDEGRENEVDMVIGAEFVTPRHVGVMRRHAGGLICTCDHPRSCIKTGPDVHARHLGKYVDNCSYAFEACLQQGAIW